jgi:predicted TIM-barrel enzyme
MGKQYTREEVIARLKSSLEINVPIYTVGVGTGISAKFCEKGGADLLITYPIAKFRMTGYSSMVGYLPICDSNAMTLEMGKREIFPATKDVPILAGLLGNDVTRDMSALLDEVKKAGFSGILNCPTISLVDGSLRLAWEETGINFEAEVKMTKMAREKDLFTHCFCTNSNEARKMVEVGCDMIVAHMGNSKGGTIGSKTIITLDEAVKKIQDICDASKKVNSEVMVICHGGPIAFPKDFKYVYERVEGLDGYMGGSSGERIPVEESILEVTKEFKNIRQ